MTPTTTDPVAPAEQVVGEEIMWAARYLALRLAIEAERAPAVAPPADKFGRQQSRRSFSPSHLAKRFVHTCFESAAPVLDTDENREIITALAALTFNKEFEIVESVMVKAEERLALTVKARPKRRPVRIQTLDQATRVLQAITQDLATGAVDAPTARAQVYAIQTLIVVMKNTQPKQLKLPTSTPATVPEIKASADELEQLGQLRMPQDPEPDPDREPDAEDLAALEAENERAFSSLRAVQAALSAFNDAPDLE